MGRRSGRSDWGSGFGASGGLGDELTLEGLDDEAHAECLGGDLGADGLAVDHGGDGEDVGAELALGFAGDLLTDAAEVLGFAAVTEAASSGSLAAGKCTDTRHGVILRFRS